MGHEVDLIKHSSLFENAYDDDDDAHKTARLIKSFAWALMASLDKLGMEIFQGKSRSSGKMNV